MTPDHDPDRVLHTARATVDGGRDGRGRVAPGGLEVRLRTPAGLGGPGGEGTDPEELFALGYAACFASAVDYHLRRRRVPHEQVTVRSDVALLSAGAGDFRLRVGLDVDLSGIDAALAAEVVRDAHRTCPYSRAMRGDAAVELRVAGVPLDV